MTYLARIACILTVCFSLAACGFHLRGNNQFNFTTLYIQGKTQLNAKLKKALANSNVSVVSDASAAEMQLELLKEESEKRILSLSGDGVVNEYEVYYRVHYRTKSQQAALWSEPQIIEARRDYSYSDANLLAKQAEEKRLNDNMQSDVLNGLMRRLAVLKK
jgi:LPS-assembly lipoprotein